jgi:WhiB family redox-sensing transcriptional regulator
MTTVTIKDIRLRGACRELDPVYGYDLHYPHSETQGCEAQIARAKQVCAGCPVQAECRQHALTHPEHGIWGGMTEDERRAVRTKNARRRMKKADTPAAATTAQADVEAVA